MNMEIFSYAGGAASRIKNTDYPSYANKRISYRREPSRNYSVGSVMFSPMGGQPAVRRPFSVPEIPLPRIPDFGIPEILGQARSLLRYMPFAAALAAIFCGAFALHGRYAGRTGALELASMPTPELEILDNAMSQFTMGMPAEYDSAGNIVDANGNVILSDGMPFKEPVSYSEYTIQKGDTISGIAAKNGLRNFGTLFSVNNITNAREIAVGQKLLIPSIDGQVHEVKADETLASLSVRYGIPLEDILDVNDLDTQELARGQKLFIPGAVMDANVLRQALGETFICPLTASWRLSSYFGPRKDPFTGVQSNHTGIDMACPAGTPINAAMGGQVAVSSYSNVYGNYVIINHGNGYQSLYAHMSKKLVKTGQSVGQGQRIGLVGSTGYSTGPHLHFTVYKNGKLTDPLKLIKR